MQLKNKKFFTINLGCRSNAYETNCISTELIKNNALKTNKLSDADICIINTCSVTNKADSKSKYFINKALRENKNVLLVVMGCFSQTNPDYFKQYKKKSNFSITILYSSIYFKNIYFYVSTGSLSNI